MTKWNSSPHPISDIRDWQNSNLLMLRPDYQRKLVWSEAARVMLIDTILRDIPMPKIFVSKQIIDQKTYRSIIDGQQRITTILAFLDDNFALVEPFSDTRFLNKKFSQLDDESKDKILSYMIDFNEVKNLSDEEIREVFSRVNKYTVVLNKQELRKADYPGDFLKLSEKISLHTFLDDIKIFSPANRKRSGDVEYVSELLALYLEGPQEKKDTLDAFYKKYKELPADQIKEVFSDFDMIFRSISILFDNQLLKTRFRQKADFYTVFQLFLHYMRAGKLDMTKDFTWLREDLDFFDQCIAPESDFSILRDYAIKCISQSNSQAARSWRFEFLKSFLDGTFEGIAPSSIEDVARFYSLADEIGIDNSGMCPDATYSCDSCEEEIVSDYSDCFICWGIGEKNFQISNMGWVHEKCSHADLVVIPRPKK